MTRRQTAALLAAAALCVVQAACGAEDPSDSGSPPAAVTFEATDAGDGTVAISGPKAIEAGVTRIALKNSGSRPHAAQLIRVFGHRTADEVISNTIDTPTAAPFPDWVVGGGGIGTVAPGASASVTELLEPGTYYLLDGEDAPDRVPNARRGGVAKFEVTGRPAASELPETKARVTARDYGFEAFGIKRGRNRFTFENDGVQLHHMIALPLADGATIGDAKEYFTTGRSLDGRPPVDFADRVNTAAIDGGERQVIELDFDKGRYALVCFITNRAGGPTHAAQGMVDELDVR
jgi:hypothetical protein